MMYVGMQGDVGYHTTRMTYRPYVIFTNKEDAEKWKENGRWRVIVNTPVFKQETTDKPIEEMTDEEWLEWLAEAMEAQAQYEQAKNEIFDNYFFERPTNEPQTTN